MVMEVGRTVQTKKAFYIDAYLAVVAFVLPSEATLPGIREPGMGDQT